MLHIKTEATANFIFLASAITLILLNRILIDDNTAFLLVAGGIAGFSFFLKRGIKRLIK